MEASDAQAFLKKGWAALVKDEDTVAVACFEKAFQIASYENNVEEMGSALLNLGICYYGVSQSKGLEYCTAAMAQFKKLESSDPRAALFGRSRCLQLAGTIYGRQGKYHEAISLSREALQGFGEKDSNGYLGLAYANIAGAYAHLNVKDSAEYFYRKALQAQSLAKNFVYLPGALVKVADIELKKENKTQSYQLLQRALKIADSTENRQAQVTALLGFGRWHLFSKKYDSADTYYLRAKKIAASLSDRSFYYKTLESFFNLKKEQHQWNEALDYREQMAQEKDSMESFDKHKLVQDLIVQFNVSEKDRKLQLLQKEKDIALLSNYVLWTTVVFVIVLAGGIILFLRRNNKRHQLLLKTKEDLLIAQEEQKRMREQYLQNELDFKERELSAMALQIFQKNELMNDLKEQMEKNLNDENQDSFNKLMNKKTNYEKDWADFNAYFESVNRNFYSRLKQNYPDISPNDLKICALIKLNLSIKEMAGVLNISPDSVKTARHRLRKRLQLNNEDNLTEFIMKL